MTTASPNTAAAPRFIVGIDLGTTNTAISYADLTDDDPAARVRDLPVLQLVAPGEAAERPLLPSALYLPTEEELAAGLTELPWGRPPYAAGLLARLRGAQVPGRVVSSAKSWLCHGGVDRTAPILPWGAPEGVPKLSPVDVSARYLAHLAQVWDRAFPEEALQNQEVVLTVPASFDEAARALTLEAARCAGIPRPTLIEEPLAAFYDWTRRHRGRLDKALGDNRIILVVDVGGGTTDLTLISAEPGKDGPVLRRLSVGRHLLLGGDNMDAAIARQAESRAGERLDAARWAALVQSSRAAKELLLSPDGPSEASVSILSRGSRLIGGAKSVVFKRRELLDFLLEGFFPLTGRRDMPIRPKRLGIQEAGLPYESDPAVTRHVAAFLSAHAKEVSEDMSFIRPDAVLLNGGVFASEGISGRLLEIIDSWGASADGRHVSLLANDALDLAVSRGAVAYGLVRRGLGLRIGGGSPRAYFIGVAGAGAGGHPQGVCLVPRHLEEDVEVEIPRTFNLLLDHPARFPLFASNLAVDAKPGDVADLSGEEFEALPQIETVLRSETASAGQHGKPVASSGAAVTAALRASLTEIGTLELWCVAKDGSGARWKLEFGLRGSGRDPADRETSEVAPMPKNFGEAKERIDIIYGKKPAPVDKRDVKSLVRDLEKLLGPRAAWPTPVIRELWAALYAGMAKRRRSADHERLWCSLVGFALRPGFGAPLDSWRVSETFRVFEQGLQFQKEPHNWEAWWVMWRRIAGGLDASAQTAMFDSVIKFVRPPSRGGKQKQAEGLQELIRTAASLEGIGAARKEVLGQALFDRLETDGIQPHLLWAIGRTGARIPFHASAHTCISPDAAEAWLDRLLKLSASAPAKKADFIFPVVQLSRISGDRGRDLSDAARMRALDFLGEARALEESLQTVRAFVPLSHKDEEKCFGESLPPGLTLSDGSGTGVRPPA